MIFVSYGQIISVLGNMTTQGDPNSNHCGVLTIEGNLCFYLEFEYRKSCTVKRDTNGKLKGNHVLFTYSQNQQSPKLNQSQKKPNSYSF
jgi:hypothetical protein